jgi:hypothetical protein
MKQEEPLPGQAGGGRSAELVTAVRPLGPTDDCPLLPVTTVRAKPVMRVVASEGDLTKVDAFRKIGLKNVAS